MSPASLTLWVVLPYVAITIFVVGLVWRLRSDRAGWNARSSQLHEQRLLRLGSPMFHIGILMTMAGHAGGLLVPAGLTQAVGVSDEAYHAVAFGMGGISGTVALVGLAILAYRRFKVPTVTGSGAAGDTVVFALLPATMLFGLGITLFGGGHNYRETVSPWLRSILMFQPDGELIAASPLGFRIHTLMALVLIACWPFTRLVHAFTVPVTYLIRPYIVYRSRDAAAMSTHGPARRPAVSRHTTGHHAMSRNTQGG